MVINNPKFQWLSYVSPSQVALHSLTIGIQADGAAIFSNIIKVGEREHPEGLKAAIKFCDSETSHFLQVMRSPVSSVHHKGFRKCALKAKSQYIMGDVLNYGGVCPLKIIRISKVVILETIFLHQRMPGKKV